ncbi:MAG: DNA polymerase I [Actinobacteria bacterium]|nr:DNA polymerase I [Actinomycetota bacterium]
MTTLMLIDGNSLTYRAFYALPTDMATASGQVTNAVFGFTSMLINLVRDHQPDRIAVTFDRPEPTFRHKMVESYKAQREASPDILRQQMGLVRQLVETLQIPILEQSGVEADDIIATLATQAAEDGIDVIIVTGDRDSYQLVKDPHIRVLYNKRGVSDYALYDEAGIVERTGVRPDQYVYYAALRGDPSDNLPGVPKVGEKTAAKLVTTYGDMDGIYAHTADQTPALRKNLEENEAQARSNVDMMTLKRDVELELRPNELTQGDFDQDAVRDLFKFLEFGTLMGRLSSAFGDKGGAELAEPKNVIEAELIEIDPAVAAERFGEFATSGAPLSVAVAWQGQPGRSELDGLAIVADRDAGEVAWFSTAAIAEASAALDALLGDGPAVIAHDIKPFLRRLLDDRRPLPAIAADTKIAAYLLDPADTRYGIDELIARYTDAELATGDAAPSGQLDFNEATEHGGMAAAREALAVAFVVDPIGEALVAQGLSDLAADIEYPLIAVLARMEHLGIGVDRAALSELNEHFTAEANRLRDLVVAEAGEEFNVNSTPQLRTILFDKLGLSTQKKTKTGYSTDAASLEKIRDQHAIVDYLLQYREMEKLRSTYGTGLLAEVGPDSRIHATFNQTVARTGRLSSDQPNLHNIPVRSEEGRRFRNVFIPSPGSLFVVADYNQIELRCIAHLAEDPGLIEAFTSGQDIHNQTAARIFGVESDQVTIEMRSKAKMVSYGLAYGMEAYGLGQRLAIPTKEAQQILDAYFEAFPAVHAYMERTVEEARTRGYTETLFGRRRRIPELSSGQRSVRMAGERQAMNAGIQGLAADIFKVALVRIDAAFQTSPIDAKLILQVHDEVICEVAPEHLDEVQAQVIDIMRHAFEMAVPLEVNVASGDSWAAAKG